MSQRPLFPLELLPPRLAAVVSDVYGQTQAAPAMIFTSIMVATATSAQNTHRVQRKEGLISNVSIYALCLAPSGSRKSTVEDIVFKPLRDIQEQLKVKHLTAMDGYKSAYQLWALEDKILQKNYTKRLSKGESVAAESEALHEHRRKEPEVPECAKLFYTDTTIEAWLSGLSQYSRASTLLDDEGGRTLKGALIHSPGQLCSLWDGKDIDVQRKHAGSFTVKSPRVSASIQVQPQIFTSYYTKMGQEARASGLFARFLMSEPISTIGSRFSGDLIRHTGALGWFYERLEALYACKEEVTLNFTPEAQALWINHYNEIECAMGYGQYLSEYKDIGSKLPENTARIAALIHLLCDDGQQISVSTLHSAICIMQWFCNETIHILGGYGPQSQFLNDANALLAFMIRMSAEGQHYVRSSHIQRVGPSRLRKRSALNPVLSYLRSTGQCQLFLKGRTQYVCLNLPAAAGLFPGFG